MEKDDRRSFSLLRPPPPPDFPDGLTDDEPTSDISDSENEGDPTTREAGPMEEDDNEGNKKKIEKKEIKMDDKGAINGVEKGEGRTRRGRKSAKEVRQEYPVPVIAPEKGTYRDPLLPDGWDPELISPLFYGYKAEKIVDVEKEKRELQKETKEGEARAVERALEVRNASISEIETGNKRRAAAREKKIQDIEALYAESQQEREKELTIKRNELREMPAAFKAFKHDWDSENDAARDAFEVRYIAWLLYLKYIGL